MQGDRQQLQHQTARIRTSVTNIIYSRAALGGLQRTHPECQIVVCRVWRGMHAAAGNQASANFVVRSELI